MFFKAGQSSLFICQQERPHVPVLHWRTAYCLNDAGLQARRLGLIVGVEAQPISEASASNVGRVSQAAQYLLDRDSVERASYLSPDVTLGVHLVVGLDDAVVSQYILLE